MMIQVNKTELKTEMINISCFVMIVCSFVLRGAFILHEYMKNIRKMALKK